MVVEEPSEPPHAAVKRLETTNNSSSDRYFLYNACMFPLIRPSATAPSALRSIPIDRSTRYPALPTPRSARKYDLSGTSSHFLRSGSPDPKRLYKTRRRPLRSGLDRSQGGGQ